MKFQSTTNRQPWLFMFRWSKTREVDIKRFLEYCLVAVYEHDALFWIDSSDTTYISRWFNEWFIRACSCKGRNQNKMLIRPTLDEKTSARAEKWPLMVLDDANRVVKFFANTFSDWRLSIWWNFKRREKKSKWWSDFHPCLCQHEKSSWLDTHSSQS